METSKIEELFEMITKIQANKYNNEETISPFILSRFISYLALDDNIFDSCILEIGYGKGNLSIGTSLLGADCIWNIDTNQNVSRNNIEIYERLYADNGTNIELLIGDIYDEQNWYKFDDIIDIVVMFMPHESGKEKRNDMKYLRSAMKFKPNIIYAILSTNIRDESLKIAQEFGMIVEVFSTLNFDQKDSSMDIVKFHFIEDSTLDVSPEELSDSIPSADDDDILSESEDDSGENLQTDDNYSVSELLN